MYLGNFTFALVLSLSAGIYIPVLLGLLLGVAPVLGLWKLAPDQESTQPSIFTAEPASPILSPLSSVK
jgi:putative membrane protein